MTHYWSSYDGYMPADMPRCGYDGSLCDYTSLYILAASLLFLGSASENL
jgi:hypothetical protein